MDIDVSIIILNYNTPELTTQCVESIVAHTHNLNYEIILVDNWSKPESKAYFEENLLFIPQLNIIYSEKNLWFGGGNNLGYSQSKGAYLFFLNSDTILFENSVWWLYDHYRTREQFTKVGFMWPRLYYDKEKTQKQMYCTRVPSLFWVFVYNVPFARKIRKNYYNRFRYADRDRDSDKEVGNCGGPAFMCSKKCFEEIGKFDERFFLYMEEFDTAMRLERLDYHNFYTAKTSIIHLENQSPKKTWKKLRTSFASMCKFFVKYI